MKKYVDSNIFLYAVMYDDARAQACRQVLKDIVSGACDAVTSVLTWDEFTYILERNLGREVAAAEGERLLRFPGLQFEPCTAALLAAAQEIHRTSQLRPRDALHVATARRAAAACIVSEDADFDAVANLPREFPSKRK